MEGKHDYQQQPQNEEQRRNVIKPEVAYSEEQLKALGIRFVRDNHREKVALHKERVDATVAKRKYEAKRANIENDNRLTHELDEEVKRIFEISCQRMASSAFHMDQVQMDEERRQRLANVRRNKGTRHRRNEAVNDATTSWEQLRCPKSPVVVKEDRVDTAQIYTVMALNQQIVDDQLKATKAHRRQLANVIDQELADARRLFPTLSASTSPVLWRPMTSAGTGQLSSLPSLPSPATSTRSPLHVQTPDTVLDPFVVDLNNTRSLSRSLKSSEPLSPQQGTSAQRRPTTSTPTRRHTTSLSQDYLQSVRKLSTRFDSPACLLPITRPELPSTLGVSTLLPNYYS